MVRHQHRYQPSASEAEEARRKREESLAGVLATIGRLRVFERRKPGRCSSSGPSSQVALSLGIDPPRLAQLATSVSPGRRRLSSESLPPSLPVRSPGMAVALAGGWPTLLFITNFGRSVAWPAIVVSIAAVDSRRSRGRPRGRLGAAKRRPAGGSAGRHAGRAREPDGFARLANAGLRAQNEELAVREEELQAQAEELAAQHEELQEAHAETARLLEEQSSLFRRLQEALLDIPQELSGGDVRPSLPSATQQAQVGGDFYDVFEAKTGRIGLLIGDVSGHGLEAARIATLVKDTVHAFAHQFRRPHLVLRETNRLLVEKNLPGFVTAFLGFLDPENGIFTYSSAGHPPPLLAADGRVVPLESIGLPLGVFADARYRDTRPTSRRKAFFFSTPTGSPRCAETVISSGSRDWGSHFRGYGASRRELALHAAGRGACLLGRISSRRRGAAGCQFLGQLG